MTDESINRRIGRIVLQQLESLQRSGVQQLARPAEAFEGSEPAVNDDATNPVPVAVTAAPSPSATRVQPPQSLLGGDESGVPVLTLPQKCEHLDQLAAEVRSCTRCPALVANRTQTVFGVGSAAARLCFFGEAPGADEDRQGEPFVGAAGQLLNKIIANGCGMRREDVYILNTLRCRPPDNRTPLPDEVDNCRPFFERQLEIIRPEFICCLGAVAAQSLLQTKKSVGNLRGQVHTYRWAKVIVTYHPAYLLRSPGQKRATWEDMKLLLREMGLPIPSGMQP